MLIERFSPEKTYKILSNNETGNLITYQVPGGYFLIEHNENYIEVKYDGDLLYQEIVCDSDYNEEELNLLFEYFARHEFGHSFLPKKILSNEEASDNIRNYENVSISDIYGAYKEFYADYFVFQNFRVIPQKFLRKWANNLFVDRSRFFDEDFPLSSYLHTNIYLCGRFYIFNKWEMINNFYCRNQLERLSILIQKIMEVFDVISERYSNINLTKKRIISITKGLDRLDFNHILHIENT